MGIDKLVNKPANIVVPVLLFILLTPGLFFDLPGKNSKLLIKSLTHGAIFAGIYILLNVLFSDFY
jgi:hypothetical protein